MSLYPCKLGAEIRYRLAEATHNARGLSTAELLAQTIQSGEDLPLHQFATYVATLPDTQMKNGLWYFTKPRGRYAPQPHFVRDWGRAPDYPPGTILRLDTQPAAYGVVIGKASAYGCVAVRRWGSADEPAEDWEVHASRCLPVDLADVPPALQDVIQAFQQSLTGEALLIHV